jgi:predicted MFS family arabinose efflux permease
MSTEARPAPLPFTSYQKFVVAMLAFLQFTIVLDFMILAPLGALLMRDLGVPASRVGFAVSIYGVSAGLSGLLAAGFADRFDRKRLLLFFYTGFVLGTLLCGLAPTYHFLLLARVVTGVFGGVIGSISLAIVADLFPMQQRGRVMGVVQSAFAASQVMGIPLGLLLSNHWGWHAPFFMIVAVSAVVGVVITGKLRPLRGHLQIQREHSPWLHLARTLRRPDYLRSLAATTVMVTGGFMMMPFGSAFVVNNLGIPNEHLTYIFLITGLCTAVSGPFLGRLSDRIGKYALFCFGSVITMVMVVIYTHLGITPIATVTLVNTLLYVGVTSRIISSSALISGVPDPADRGAFMSVTASVQQFSGSLAAALGGLVISQDAQGRLLRYDTLGYLTVVSMMLAMTLLYPIHRLVMAKLARPPAVAAPAGQA